MGVIGVFLRGAGMVIIHELFLFDIIIDVLSNIFIKSVKPTTLPKRTIADRPAFSPFLSPSYFLKNLAHG